MISSVKIYFTYTVLFFSISAGLRAQSKDKPNIIYILVDDMGFSELGCYGNKFNETPNIDKLAAGGVRFTNFYVPSPVCSPSRAGLLTGQYPARTGITDYLRPNSEIFLDTAQYILPEMLRDNGYHTGIVGKWHLSGYLKNGASKEFLPETQGFEEVLINERQGISLGPYWYPYQFDPTIRKKLPVEHEFLVDRMNREAVEFIERNKEQPFFLYLSHYAIHTNLHGKPELVDHFRNKDGAGHSPPANVNKENDPYKNWPADFAAERNNPHLAAQLFSIDEGVGLIMDALKKNNLDKNTIVILTSDNGGETRVTTNAPLRGGKSMLYEGGVREPFIAWQPKLFPARVETQRAVNMDIYPTIMEIADVKTSRQKLDGISLLNLFTNKRNKLPERDFFWYYPLEKPHFLGGRSAASILSGDWKLISFFDTGEKELYNLKQDPSETTNVALKNNAKLAILDKKLELWMRDVKSH